MYCFLLVVRSKQVYLVIIGRTVSDVITDQLLVYTGLVGTLELCLLAHIWVDGVTGNLKGLKSMGTFISLSALLSKIFAPDARCDIHGANKSYT